MVWLAALVVVIGLVCFGGYLWVLGVFKLLIIKLLLCRCLLIVLHCLICYCLFLFKVCLLDCLFV